MLDLGLSADAIYSICALVALILILVWLVVRALRLRRAQKSDPDLGRTPVGEESKVARLGWAGLIALGAVIIAWITALTPVLTASAAEVSALTTALTGNLSSGCCENLPETFEASTSQFVAAWVQTGGVTVAALAAVFLALRRGNQIVAEADAEAHPQN